MNSHSCVVCTVHIVLFQYELQKQIIELWNWMNIIGLLFRDVGCVFVLCP